MTGRLSNRSALVIGGARGIGAAIAERFFEEGARVVIADTEEAAGRATAERLKGRFIATDISQKADAERAVNETVTAYGGLDIIVQNAGIYPWTLIENIEPEEWDKGWRSISRAPILQRVQHCPS
jgi:3-oxoacyl-[acyl-carrier protein] reductase